MRRIRSIFLLSLAALSIAALLGCSPSTGSDSPSAPAAPAGLAVSGTPTSASVSLSWTAVSEATGYRIYRSSTQTGTFTKVGSDISSGTAFTDSGLAASTTYWYKASAYNANGESGKSAAVSATTVSSGGGGAAPATPAGLAVSGTPTSASITLTWNAVSSATGYRVYRSSSQSGTYAQTGADVTSGTTLTDSSLAASTTYWYEVSAYNAGGESAKSSAVSGTTASSGGGGSSLSGSILYSTTGDSEIHCVGYDGSNDKALTAIGLGYATLKYAVWSPDGTKILIGLRGTSGNVSLYTVASTVTGSNPAAISLGSYVINDTVTQPSAYSTINRYALWLDNDTIIFVGKSSSDTSLYTGYGFYKLTLSSGAIAPIKESISACADFEISPDDSKIVFQAVVSPNYHLCSIPTSGGTVTDLFPSEPAGTNLWSPHWLSNTKLVFIRQTASPAKFNLDTANADGSSRTDIVSGLDYFPQIAASPLGTKIAYTVGSGSSRKLHCIGADGSGDLTLMSAYTAYGFDWSPDASTIALYAIQGAESNVFLVQPDGTSAGKVWASGKYLNALGPYRPWHN